MTNTLKILFLVLTLSFGACSHPLGKISEPSPAAATAPSSKTIFVESWPESEKRAHVQLGYQCPAPNGDCPMNGSVLIYFHSDELIELKVSTVAHESHTCDNQVLMKKEGKNFVYRDQECLFTATLKGKEQAVLETKGCRSWCGMRGYVDGTYR